MTNLRTFFKESPEETKTWLKYSFLVKFHPIFVKNQTFNLIYVKNVYSTLNYMRFISFLRIN